MYSGPSTSVRATHLSRFPVLDRSHRRTNGDARVNPWLRHLEPHAPPTVARPALPQPARKVPLTPQPGVAAPAPDQQLARRLLVRRELSTLVWWIGAHGGAGETVLERLLAGSRAADHAWPISPDPARPACTMLVARTSYTGLTAAQQALCDWGSGSVAVDLIGLVLIADAPGKLPRELRGLVELIDGAAPGPTWLLPWQAGWRFAPPSLERASRPLRELLHLLNPHKEA
jgi:hypothetical protein